MQAAVPESPTFWSFVGIQLAGPPVYASPSASRTTSLASPPPRKTAQGPGPEAGPSTVSPAGQPAAAAAAASADIDAGARLGHTGDTAAGRGPGQGQGEAGADVALRRDVDARFSPGLTSIETFDWSYRSSTNLLKRVIRRSGMICGAGSISRGHQLSD